MGGLGMRVAHRFHGKSCSLDGVIVPLTRKRLLITALKITMFRKLRSIVDAIVG